MNRQRDKRNATAILFVSGLGSDPKLRVAGRRLVDRALLALGRAGVPECLVVGNAPSLRSGHGRPRIVQRLADDAGRATQELQAKGLQPSDYLVCTHATAVFQPGAIENLRGQACGETIALAADTSRAGTGQPAPIAVAPLKLLRSLWPAIRGGNGAALRQLASSEQAVVLGPGDSFASSLPARQAVARLERDLLLSLENPQDGRVDQLLNRRISRPLSRFFMRLPLHPTHITLLSFLAALLAALSFGRGTYVSSVAGALMFQLAAVLDCCDGEVARAKFLESRPGDVLDISLDAIGNAALFAGIARGSWVTQQLHHAGALGFAAAAGIIASFGIVTYVERRFPPYPRAPAHRLAQQLVSNMTTRDFSVIVLLAAAANVLPWFLWGAAIGANIFWVFLLALVLRAGAPVQAQD